MKPVKTTRNHPNRPKKMRNDPKQLKISQLENSGFSTSFRFSNFEPECPNFGVLSQKVLLSNIHKISHAPYFECADFKLLYVFENFEPKSPNLDLLSQKILTL